MSAGINHISFTLKEMFDSLLLRCTSLLVTVHVISRDLDLCSRPKRNSRALLPILIYINCMSSDYVRLPEYAAARGEGLEHGDLEIRSR